VSGVLGLQRASDGITGTSISIAQQQASLRSTSDLLSDVATQQLGNVGSLLPSGGDSLTNDLVSLSVNLTNAQASAQVLDVANETVGRIIDELA
jgi:hypothetical protein